MNYCNLRRSIISYIFLLTVVNDSVYSNHTYYMPTKEIKTKTHFISDNGKLIGSALDAIIFPHSFYLLTSPKNVMNDAIEQSKMKIARITQIVQKNLFQQFNVFNHFHFLSHQLLAVDILTCFR